MQSNKKEKVRRSSRQQHSKIYDFKKRDRCGKDVPSSSLNDLERPCCLPHEVKESHKSTSSELCYGIPTEKTKTKACPTVYGLMSKVRF